MSLFYLHIMDADNDTELERRAVEELLKEASRARVRAETMGPAGWMKCPLKSTNKRFLLNTLRSSALDRQSGSRSSIAGRGENRSYDHREAHERKGHGCRKDNECRLEHSHSQSLRHGSSSGNDFPSGGHSPSYDKQSKRRRSRSPIRNKSEMVWARTKK